MYTWGIVLSEWAAELAKLERVITLAHNRVE